LQVVSFFLRYIILWKLTELHIDMLTQSFYNTLAKLMNYIISLCAPYCIPWQAHTQDFFENICIMPQQQCTKIIVMLRK